MRGRHQKKWQIITDLYDVNVGLVSGENAFFVINQEIVDKFHLQESG